MRALDTVAMADCGVGGTTLDRTVQSLLGTNAAQSKAAAAARSVANHASQRQSSFASPMPLAAPAEMLLPSAQVQGPQISSNAPATALSHEKRAIVQSTRIDHGLQIYHPLQTQQAFPQQQQQMMMMQSMMMQQQQQLAQMVQQQQQQQKQQSQASTHQSNSIQQDASNAQLKAQVQNHLENLSSRLEEPAEGFVQGASIEELATAWAEAGDHEYNEGFVQGASIEELANAWAEAEAEYSQEVQDMVNDATNLAAGLNLNSEGILGNSPLPYEFVNKVDAAHATQGTKDPSVQDWMDEGMRQFNAGNIKEAIRAFEMELQLSNQDNAKAWRMLGRCHAENDQDREAILCLEHAVEKDPYSQEALLDLGVSYVNELNHEKALESLMAWITNNPNYAGMELTDDLYGSSNASHGDVTNSAAFEEVQRLLLRALEYNQNDSVEVLQALGVVYNVSRDYDAAVDSFQKALQIKPDDYQLWNKLGATLANSSRSERALSAYHRALQIKPKYARAWLNMAIANSNLQNYKEAARCYLQTLSLSPSAVHCWSYLRIALSCSEEFELIPFAAARDLAAFQDHFDFVLYSAE